MKYAVAYIIIVNILAFCLYGIDKSAAIKQKQRIPNRVLLLTAAFGGSLGALAGMYTFRHKTKKWYYTITVPALLIIQITAAVLLLSAWRGTPYTNIPRVETVILLRREKVDGHIEVDLNVEKLEDKLGVLIWSEIHKSGFAVVQEMKILSKAAKAWYHTETTLNKLNKNNQYWISNSWYLVLKRSLKNFS